jgi:hypothetical protein
MWMYRIVVKKRHETINNISDARKKIMVLATLTAINVQFHCSVLTETHYYHRIYIVLRRLYFLHPVMAAAWFGSGTRV